MDFAKFLRKHSLQNMKNEFNGNQTANKAKTELFLEKLNFKNYQEPKKVSFSLVLIQWRQFNFG